MRNGVIRRVTIVSATWKKRQRFVSFLTYKKYRNEAAFTKFMYDDGLKWMVMHYQSLNKPRNGEIVSYCARMEGWQVSISSTICGARYHVFFKTETEQSQTGYLDSVQRTWRVSLYLIQFTCQSARQNSNAMLATFGELRCRRSVSNSRIYCSIGTTNVGVSTR